MRPRTLRILGQKFEVRFQKEIVDPDDGGSLLGFIEHDWNRIRVSTNQHPDSQRETYLHESLHALLSKVGWGVARMGKEHEELVDQLAPVLLDFIRANPRVIEYLQERRAA